MIYFYYGANDYLVQEKLNLFRSRYLEKFGNALNVWNLSTEGGLGPLDDNMRTVSLFAETKLVFVEGIAALAEEEATWLIARIEEAGVARREDFVLVFSEARDGASLQKEAGTLFRYFLSIGTHEEFKQLRSPQLLVWMRKYMSARGASMSETLARKLLERVGSDMRQLSYELEKVAAHANYRGNVTERDLVVVASYEKEENVFRLVDALLARKVGQAVRDVRARLSTGEPPERIIGNLAYAIRTLLIVKDTASSISSSQLASATGLHPFVIKKNLAFARNFTLSELYALHASLFEADLSIKTGRAEGEEALEMFILSAGLPAQTGGRRRD